MSNDRRATLANGSPAVLPLNTTTYLDFEKPLARIEHDIAELELECGQTNRSVSADIKQQRSRYRTTLRRLYTNLTPWETVLVARHPQRPLTTDYLKTAFRDVCELHGDRCFGDDGAIISAFARVGRHRVMVIGHNKGKDIKERIACNFGCAHPEGYRKALGKMRLAQKYGLPVVCLVDTQGAFPGVGSEERGISHAIAVNLMEMARLRTPIVSVVIGEGGSGGALGLAVADRVAMFQHSFYSVISPEGCAAILWKTAERRQHAAEALRLTSKELSRLGAVDDVISEPVGGAHRDPAAAAESLEKYVVGALDSLKRMKIPTLVRKRQDRVRHICAFWESPAEAKAEAEAAKKKRSTRRATSRSSRISRRFTQREKVSG